MKSFLSSILLCLGLLQGLAHADTQQQTDQAVAAQSQDFARAAQISKELEHGDNANQPLGQTEASKSAQKALSAGLSALKATEVLGQQTQTVALIKLPGLDPQSSEVLLSSLCFAILCLVVVYRFSQVLTFGIWSRLQTGSTVVAVFSLPAQALLVMNFVWLFITGLAFAVVFDLPASLSTMFYKVLAATEYPSLLAMQNIPALVEQGVANHWYWHYMLASAVFAIAAELWLAPLAFMAKYGERNRKSNTLDRIHKQAQKWQEHEARTKPPGR